MTLNWRAQTGPWTWSTDKRFDWELSPYQSLLS
jgi:hypothetical protein